MCELNEQHYADCPKRIGNTEPDSQLRIRRQGFCGSCQGWRAGQSPRKNAGGKVRWHRHKDGQSGLPGGGAKEFKKARRAWKKKFSKTPVPGGGDQAAEIRRLKQELARVTEERDILKKATAYFAKDAK